MATNTTSTDKRNITESVEQPAPELTPDQRSSLLREAILRTTRAKTNIMGKSPFWGTILVGTNFVYTFEMPTWAVDDKGNIYINPQFTSTLTIDEITGVMMHELLHIINLTLLRIGYRDRKLWNIATDYVMNHWLTKIGYKLPEGGLIPENGIIKVKGRDLSDPTGQKSKKYTFDINGKNAEWLYDELEKVAFQNGEDGDGEGDGEGKEGKGEKDGDKQGKGKGKNGQHVIDKQWEDGKKSGGDHIYTERGDKQPGIERGKLNNKTPQELEEELRQLVQAADDGNPTSQEGDAGTGEGGIRGYLRELWKPAVNWRQMLRDFITKGSYRYDWSRPNKRGLGAGVYLPKMRPDKVIEVAIAIDTSGSIGDVLIKRFISEVVAISKMAKAKITMIYWHTEVYKVVEVKDASAADIVNSTKGLHFGGTAISSIAEYFRDNKIDEPKAIVFLTDGFVESNPKFPMKSAKLAFVPFEGGDDSVLKKYMPTYKIKTYEK